MVTARSKKRKISVVLLALLLVILALDRTFLGASNGVTEVAASTVEPTIPIPATNSTLEHANKARAPLASVAGRLDIVLAERGSDPTGLPNIFRHPLDWTDPDRSAVTINPQNAPADDFLMHHRFTAVMITSGESMAVIDGRAVRVGAPIGDFILTEVGPRSITIERSGQTGQIHLDGDLSSND